MRPKLAAAICLGFLLGGAYALAQDRTITVREVDIQPTAANISIRTDGGCVLTAYATVSAPSVEPVYSRSQYDFNGPRCTTVKAAIVRAAKLDLSVGDGTAP